MFRQHFDKTRTKDCNKFSLCILLAPIRLPKWMDGMDILLKGDVKA